MDDQRTDRTGGGGVRFRKLRIAWSVAWGVLAVMLIALWICSYFYACFLNHVRNGTIITLNTAPGQIQFVQTSGNFDAAPEWHFGSYPTTSEDRDRLNWGFDWVWTGQEVVMQTPICFPVALAAAFGSLPWIRQRFSLRTLLIATTLVAVLLGIAVMMLRGS